MQVERFNENPFLVENTLCKNRIFLKTWVSSILRIYAYLLSQNITSSFLKKDSRHVMLLELTNNKSHTSGVPTNAKKLVKYGAKWFTEATNILDLGHFLRVHIQSHCRPQYCTTNWKILSNAEQISLKVRVRFGGSRWLNPNPSRLLNGTTIPTLTLISSSLTLNPFNMFSKKILNKRVGWRAGSGFASSNA